VILVARGLDADAFGGFAVVYASVLFLLALSRAFFGTVLTTTPDMLSATHQLKKTLGALLILVPVISGFVVVVGLVLAPGNTGSTLVLACAAPLVLIQDQFRFGAIAVGRPAAALASDSAWLLLVLMGLFVGTQGAAGALMWWLAGIVSAALIIWLMLGARPNMRGGMELLRGGHLVAASRAGGTLAVQGAVLILAALVAGVLGSEAVGSIRGAGTLMGPVNLLNAFAVLAFTASMTRARQANRRMIAAQIATGLAGAALVTGGVLLALPADVGELLLGDTWAQARQVLPWTVLEYTAVGVLAAALIGLTVEGAAKSVVIVSCLQGALIVAIGGLCALAFGTAESVVQGTGAAAWVSAGVAWLALLTADRRRRSS
jgi:hypothetical protein